MGVSLSVGNYAAHPFCLEGLGLHVYCAEELCYCLKENAFLLDMDLLSDKLVNWIRQECGLEDLAKELYTMVHRKGSLSAFVTRILEYVGFYDLQEIQEVERILKRGAGLSILEKRALRIDQLLDLHKYVAAISEYDALLSSWDEASAGSSTARPDLKSKLFHNRGIALAGLMRYRHAAESFYSAYETDGNEESLRCFFVAKRMELKAKDYVAFAAGMPEYTDVTLKLEKEVERMNKVWESCADYHRLNTRPLFREEHEPGYQEESGHILAALKEAYRSQATF